jgi:integrase
MHRVPLSAPAVALLLALKTEAECAGVGSPFIFQGDVPGKPLQDIKGAWRSICHRAGIAGVRIHDLRHTYASHLVSGGVGLPVIGRLLGHTQSATTLRYAHLADDPLREATGRFGALVGGALNEK